MNKISERLVNAAFEALAALPNDRTNVAEDAKVATTAVLRELARISSGNELDALAGGSDVDWPLPEDLVMLADDVERSL